jgi:hypothetical protein
MMPIVTLRGALAGGLLAALVAGCAGFGPIGLEPGRSRGEDVLRSMGEPVERWNEPDGGALWVYPRGPQGFQTYMLRLDRDGVLRSVQDVMNERGFSRVEIRKSDREAVRRALGPPLRTTYFPLRKELVWDYRFRDAWGYPAFFHVMFDEAGIVTGTMQMREFRNGRGKH